MDRILPVANYTLGGCRTRESSTFQKIKNRNAKGSTVMDLSLSYGMLINLYSPNEILPQFGGRLPLHAFTGK